MHWHWIIQCALCNELCSVPCTEFNALCTDCWTMQCALHMHHVLNYALHALWWYHWIGNGLRCAVNDPNQSSRISHRNAPSRQIVTLINGGIIGDIENKQRDSKVNTCCMKPMLFQDVLGTKVSLIEGRRSWIPSAVKSHHQMLGIPANYFIFLSTQCAAHAQLTAEQMYRFGPIIPRQPSINIVTC